MGYEEGKLEIMRMKAMELIKQRYQMAEADAAKPGAKNFTFDGEVYKTPERLLKAQAEKEKETEDNENKTIIYCRRRGRPQRSG